MKTMSPSLYSLGLLPCVAVVAFSCSQPEQGLELYVAARSRVICNACELVQRADQEWYIDWNRSIRLDSESVEYVLVNKLGPPRQGKGTVALLFLSSSGKQNVARLLGRIGSTFVVGMVGNTIVTTSFVMRDESIIQLGDFTRPEDVDMLVRLIGAPIVGDVRTSPDVPSGS